MKQFFKFFSASCLGTLVALCTIFFVFFLIAISSAPSSAIKSNAVLQLDFKSLIPEKTDNVRDEGLLYGEFEYTGLHRIIELIKHAKTDSRIKMIVLETAYPSAGNATTSSLRKALVDFKDSGKELLAYGDFFSQKGYYLATAADSIILNPNGSIDLRGFSIVTLHFKNLMEKLGIKMNVYYQGKYKSATESFRRENMSPESKFQYGEYLKDVKSEVFEAIAISRNLSIDQIDRIADQFASTNSDSAMTLGLADRLLYKQEFEKTLKAKLGLSESRKINYISLSEYHHDVQIKTKNTAKDRIAVIHAEGEILYDVDDNGVISYKRYKTTLERIARSNDIKGVVIRVNSPGGVGFVADNLWKALKDIQDSGKFITVSMGDYAASGGYYISCLADTIVAHPTSLTGSIGVYIMFPEFHNLLKNKLGITLDSVKTHTYSSSMTSFFPQRPDEDRIIQQVTDEMYNKFLSRVADGRQLTTEEAHQLAQGRIWSGKMAKEIGLVDELGDLEDAIEITARALDLEEYRITEYPTIKTDIYRELLKTMSQNMMIRTFHIARELDQAKKLNSYFRNLSQYKLPQARLPIFEE